MFFRVISKPQTLLAVSAISFERKTVATGLGSLQPLRAFFSSESHNRCGKSEESYGHADRGGTPQFEVDQTPKHKDALEYFRSSSVVLVQWAAGEPNDSAPGGFHPN